MDVVFPQILPRVQAAPVLLTYIAPISKSLELRGGRSYYLFPDNGVPGSGLSSE